LQPFLGSGEASNCISGKIRFGDETLATVSGHWDQEVFIKDKRSEVTCWCCFELQQRWLTCRLCNLDFHV